MRLLHIPTAGKFIWSFNEGLPDFDSISETEPILVFKGGGIDGGIGWIATNCFGPHFCAFQPHPGNRLDSISYSAANFLEPLWAPKYQFQDFTID